MLLCSTNWNRNVYIPIIAGPSVRGPLTDDENVLHSSVRTLYFKPVNISAKVHSLHMLSTESPSGVWLETDHFF